MSRRARIARLSISAIFLLHGILVASWAARVPDIKREFSLSDSALGVSLFMIGIGSIVAMPVTGALVSRLGSRLITILTGLAMCASLPLIGLARDPVGLAACLFVYGAFIGSMDVAMNAQAAATENEYGRPIMASFHGMWSVGGLIGAPIGGAFAGGSVPYSAHFAVIGLFVLIGYIAGFAGLLPASSTRGHDEGRVRMNGTMLALGVLAFFVLLSEGAIADWSAVFLRSEAGASPAQAPLGYAAFSLAMAVGRFLGDPISHRFGRVALARLSGVLVAGGMLAALSVAQPPVVIAGLASVGLGLSVMFPNILSAASRAPGQATGPAIAAISTAGYAGFLIGPPVIGFISDPTSLRWGLSVLIGAGVLILVLSRFLAPVAVPERER